MRGCVALLLVLALPGVAALDPYVLLIDWQEGRALAPTTPFATLPVADAFPFDATRCHPHLVLDLLYDPDSLVLDVPNAGSASLSYEFRIEVHDADGLVREKRIQRSGYGHVLGPIDEEGAHELRLSLGWGADVPWQARLRARLATEDPACNPPL